MPSHKQTSVEAPVTNGALGSSDSARVAASFPASPIHSGKMTPESIAEVFQVKVLDGKVNDDGHTFGEFDRDFVGAPDYSQVPTGGGGLPASAWVPNPVSPGPGSMNPTDQAAAPAGFGTEPSNPPGTGVGSQLSPANSSAAQSSHKLGDYIKGKGPTAS